MITFIHSPAYCAVQDRGWLHSRRAGMPVSGAMDPWALNTANALVGNYPYAAGIEWALTAGRVRFEREVEVAICGPGVELLQIARAGDEVELPRPTIGRFHYLAVRGGVDAKQTLGSCSTYAIAGLGTPIKTGDRLSIGTLHPHQTPATRTARPVYESGTVRVVEGPQRDLFGNAEWERFLGAEWRVSRASDRMGYRLEGGAPLATPADQLSEAACVGAVQVPPDGMPIVLMADGPTVGGYPKIAVVITADLPILAQRLPGQSLRFQAMSVSEAQMLIRAAPPVPPPPLPARSER